MTIICNRTYISFYKSEKISYLYYSLLNNPIFKNKAISSSNNLYPVLLEKIKALQFFFIKSVYILDIQVTLNNIYVTVTLHTGQVVFVGSGGGLKLKNSKRNTTYVLQLLLIFILKRLRKKNKIIILKVYNLKKKYRKVLLKYLLLYGLRIFYIYNIFKKVYNGVRLKKRRRI